MSDFARWFARAARELRGWRRDDVPLPAGGNRVRAFIDPGAYYYELGAAIRATRPHLADFVYIAGWELDLQTYIDPPQTSPRNTLYDLVAERSETGVRFRVLLDSTSNRGSNELVAAQVGSRKNGGGIVDPFHQPTGSQHQKVAIIRNANGVVAFCGGMDIANHRLGRDGYPPPGAGANPPPAGAEMQHAPWHDVQVAVEGPAVCDIWNSYVQRWKASAEAFIPGTGVRFVRVYGEDSITEPDQLDSARNAGDMVTQVVRTYPNMSVPHLHVPPRISSPLQFGYSFAATGERGNYDTIVHALSQTRETIYLEDQYLVDSARSGTTAPITDALRDAISQPSFKSMVIAIAGTGTVQGELFQAASRRREFITSLGSAAVDKVAVYTYSGDLNSPYWFHAKTWIFDDEFGLVTSANCNRRSYTCDAEIGLAITGQSATDPGLTFAKDLRTRLWLKHLNGTSATGSNKSVRAPVTAEQVSDFATAARLWDGAPLLVRTRLELDQTPDLSIWDRVGVLKKYPALDRSDMMLIIRSMVGRTLEWDLIDPDAS